MQISEIRIKLVENRSDRLKAFCSVTFDNQFVIRDLKIIEGTDGFFVAMPSRKLTDRCPKCGSKNHLRAKFCNECGAKLPEEQNRQHGSRTKLHADIAHPINTKAREYIQKEIDTVVTDDGKIYAISNQTKNIVMNTVLDDFKEESDMSSDRDFV